MARGKKPERRIWIRSIRRDPPDLQKLGRALIALAEAEHEKEAQAEAEQAEQKRTEGEDSSEEST